MRDDAKGTKEGTFSVYGEGRSEDQSGKGANNQTLLLWPTDSVKLGDIYSNLQEKGFIKTTWIRIMTVRNPRREHVSPIIPSYISASIT